MRKILKIDAVEVLERTGKHFFRYQLNRSNRGRAESALSVTQLEFLKDKQYVFRSHPKHTTTIELFINETTVENSEWSMLYLLFNRGR